YEEAVKECHRALEASDSGAEIGVAWVLAELPVPKYGDPALAIEIARKVIQTNPKDSLHWRTLGLAQYRASDTKGAIESLNEALRLETRQPIHTLLFLSMAHGRLGNREQALSCYDKAVGYIKKSGGTRDEQMLGFRAEAAKLLGIKEQDTKDKE